MDGKQKHYIDELLDYLKLSASSFAKSIGYDSPNRIYYILRFRNGVSKEVAKDITDAYPDVNYNWLLTGKGEMLKTGNIHVVGDGNISNTGITGGDVAMGTDQEVTILKKRIKELEAEVKELKNDKAILKEFVTMLQNKK